MGEPIYTASRALPQVFENATHILSLAMYTLKEVQSHNKPDDVWIVLHNKVYDVTKYLEDHPGGSAILIEVGGTDATEAFEETGHSDEAHDELAKFHIGDLPPEVCFPLLIIKTCV